MSYLIPIKFYLKPNCHKSHNKITQEKALSIKEVAANTFGIKIVQDAFAFQLNQLFERLIFLNEQIKKTDAEIGNIRRFKNSSSLVAYAGIDPSVKQSGEFHSTHNHMSKRGSSYLRHAIFLAACTCAFHDSPMNEYYKKKRHRANII